MKGLKGPHIVSYYSVTIGGRLIETDFADNGRSESAPRWSGVRHVTCESYTLGSSASETVDMAKNRPRSLVLCFEGFMNLFMTRWREENIRKDDLCGGSIICQLSFMNITIDRRLN